MGKIKQLAAVIADLFPSSEQVVSEKLSAEEFTSFGADVAELNERLEAQAEGNAKVVADLAASTLELTEMAGKLEAAEKLVAAGVTELGAVSFERDKYKAHYEKAAAAGTIEGEADANSKGATRKLAGYNEQAVEAFNKAHSK